MLNEIYRLLNHLIIDTMKSIFTTKTLTLVIFSFLLSTALKAQSEYTIYIGNSGFSQNNLTVEVGDYVHFMLDLSNNSGTHYSASTSIPSGAASWNYMVYCSTCKYTVACTVPGVYQYTDSNSGMSGTFTVNAPPPSNVVDATINNVNATGSFAYFPGTVTNTDLNSSVEVEMTFNNVTMPAGWALTMCSPGGCFPNGVVSSTFTLAANSNATVQIDMFSGGVVGTGSVLVRFENTANNTDFKEFLVQLDNSATGIAESGVGITLLKNYPNPFIYSTTIVYENNSHQGEIQIVDELGRMIGVYALESKSGEIAINENLNSGIYFYSLWDNGELVERKKMQVIK